MNYYEPVRRLLERSQPGPRKSVRADIRRGGRLAQLIAGRWPDINRPEQWRAKHVRWVLEHGLSDLAPGTRYRYYLTVRVIASALGRWDNWQHRLSGPWCDSLGRPHEPRHPGGRPPRLPGRR